MELPIQVLVNELPKYVNFRYIISYIQATKHKYELYKNDIEQYIKVNSKITESSSLRRNQYFMYKSIRCHNKVLFQAPYGYGKTYIGIKWILDLLSDDLIDLSVIFAPPTAIKTWVAKLTEVGLYNANPEKSQVLVRHSSRPKHAKYFKDNKSLLEGGSISSIPELMPRIILCSKMDNYQCTENFRIGCIEDECHRKYETGGRDKLRHNSLYSLMLTGTSMKTETHVKIQTYENREVENNVNMTYMKAPSTYELLFDHVVNMITDDTKIVICIPKQGKYNEIMNKIKVTFGKRVFNLVGSEATKNRFEKSTNGILLISIASSEAITICTPNVVIVNTDEISVQRLGQLFGRFTRAENLHESINITCITNNPARTRYASTQLVSDWSKTFMLDTSMDTILVPFRILDVDYYTCERRDVLIITHAHLSKLNEMISYWEDNKGPKTQLTTEKINMLYFPISDPYNL